MIVLGLYSDCIAIVLLPLYWEVLRLLICEVWCEDCQLYSFYCIEGISREHLYLGVFKSILTSITFIFILSLLLVREFLAVRLRFGHLRRNYSHQSRISLQPYVGKKRPWNYPCHSVCCSSDSWQWFAAVPTNRNSILSDGLYSNVVLIPRTEMLLHLIYVPPRSVDNHISHLTI